MPTCLDEVPSQEGGEKFEVAAAGQRDGYSPYQQNKEVHDDACRLTGYLREERKSSNLWQRIMRRTGMVCWLCSALSAQVKLSSARVSGVL